jgi:hypothetical protein
MGWMIVMISPWLFPILAKTHAVRLLAAFRTLQYLHPENLEYPKVRVENPPYFFLSYACV